MKRVKIMLLSFTLLAAIGGVLAFKANYGPFPYCYTTTTFTAAPTCSMGYFVPNISGAVVYTTRPVIINGLEQCQFKADATRLTCTTSIRVVPN